MTFKKMTAIIEFMISVHSAKQMIMKGGVVVDKYNIRTLQVCWLVSAFLLAMSGIVMLNVPDERLIELSWIPGLAMLFSGCINVFVYQKNKRRIHGADWLLAEGMSTALLALFPLFNQMIQPVMIPFFFGVWELISGLLKAIDTKGMFDEKIRGRRYFLVIAALELLSGVASLIKPVDDLLGMNRIIAVIMFVQSVGLLLKSGYCRYFIIQ